MTSFTAVNKIFDVVIVGGGLSGLVLANEIQQTIPSYSWNLLEARSTLGGRLANDDRGNQIDLGGAWVWPDFQPKMKQLIQSLNIPTFLQPDDPSSTRIDGGAVKIIQRLSENLPAENIRTNTPVLKCVQVDESDQVCAAKSHRSTSDDSKIIRLETTNGTVFAKYVILALPPRLIDRHILFDPPLSATKQLALKSSHTWMAGVTKISLVYGKKFWTEDISNMGLPQNMPGPAFQLYDASTKDGTVNAITFFTLVLAGSPARNDDRVLADQVSSQIAGAWKLLLAKDFREQAKQYRDVHVRHWPQEKYISEDPNPTKIHPHPHPVRALSETEWGGQLLFAGSETDQQSPGVMEGAVGAAIRVAKELQAQR